MQKLLAVEDVILKSSGMIISDPLVKDIFLSDSKSVFQITIGAVAHIEQVAKTGKMPVDNNWQASIVRKLVDISEDREMCAGFRIVDDHRHDHAFICLTNQMKLICEQMVVTTTLKPRNLKFSNRASKSAPPGILTSVFNTIQTKLKPPALISKELYPLFVDANLDVISKEVSSTRDSIKLVYSLYNELEAQYFFFYIAWS